MVVDNQEQVEAIRSNLTMVQENIARAAVKSGRKAEDVQLVAVTKLMPLETLRAGISAGIRCFGENYAEQAAEKIKELAEAEDIDWHMIGHIQSRKSRTVCEFFDMVHSIDRMKIANHLDRHCREFGKTMPVLIEVNLTGQDSKFGWQAWNPEEWDELLAPFAAIAALQNLEIRGLMTMPPLFDDPEATRPIYQRLRKLQHFLRESLPAVRWDDLSIGTTFDYMVAVEEGATMVRVGTAIFGERPS
jgi:PLP dependent protein